MAVSRRRPPRLLAPIACAALLLGAGSAGADPKEAYRQGVEAAAAGRWADAERFFRAALAERPRERVSRLLGTVYLPHYHLGVALAERGDCRAALAAWTESLEQGAIQKARQELQDLDRRRQRCRSHLRQVDAARAEIEELLATTADAAEALASLGRTPELAPAWRQGDPSFAARQDAAEQRLVAARERFAEGSRTADLGLLDAAGALAQQALAGFEDVSKAARKRLAERDAATARALEKLEKAEQSARRELRSIADLKPYPQTLGARAAALERTLGEIARSRSGAGPQVLARLTGELTTSLAALRRAARRPPRSLARAAEAYFGGAFEEALELLADERLAGDARARRHACLLRAASRYSLWVLGGERDDALHDLAVQDVAACRSEDDPLTPGPRYFSPRFVDFHRATVDALAAAELEAAREAAADAGEAAAAQRGAGDEDG